MLHCDGVRFGFFDSQTKYMSSSPYVVGNHVEGLAVCHHPRTLFYFRVAGQHPLTRARTGCEGGFFFPNLYVA